VTVYWLDSRGSLIQFPVRARHFIFYTTSRPTLGFNTLCAKDTRGIFPRSKAAGAWNWPLKSQCNCTFAIPYAFVALNGDSFTFKDRNVICNISEHGPYVRKKKLSIVLYRVVGLVLIIFVNSRFHNLLLCMSFMSAHRQCICSNWNFVTFAMKPFGIRTPHPILCGW
jgi:hypothetical protein